MTIWGQLRAKRLEASLRREEASEERKREAQKLISRYREPLAHAGFELQSRVFNILVQGLIDVYYIRGTDRDKEYVVNNTAFLIGQYFGWVEIIRSEGQFLDLGEEVETKHLSEILDTVTNTWLRDDFGPVLKIFRGDQRGIGEQMIRRLNHSPECIGYATFLNCARDDTARFIGSLLADIEHFVGNPKAAAPRLKALQHALIDLIDFLDPNFSRFPAERRTKIEQRIA